MITEQNMIKSEKEINLDNKENDLNDLQYSKDKNVSMINMDKEQLFKSFLLFQDFLSKNPNLINQNSFLNTVKEEDIAEKKETSSQNDNKSPKLSAEKLSTTIEANNNENNNTVKLYDEIPIKSTGYNFVELLEKSLAKEENTKLKNNNINNLKTKSNKNITGDSKEKENTKSTNEKTENPINQIKNDNDKNITGFINKEIDDIKVNNNINNELEKENKNKADIISKEINKINIKESKDELFKQEDKINNGKEISIINDLINENSTNLTNMKNIVSNDEINNIYQLEINDLESENNEDKENININNNQKILLNNNKTKKNNDLNTKDNSIKDKTLFEKNFQFDDLENGSALNKEKLIHKKIKELNSEIIKFREEKAKIIKLKSEYEKIQTKLMNDVQQFNYKKAEFEKYRNEELNKIKIEKKKLIIENKTINNIKFQNQSYAMIIKKDKETIENLKKQILDLQFLLKQKETENKNNKISVGRKNGINNLNKRLDEVKFDNTKNSKQEKRNHSTEIIKISNNNKNNENNTLYQTEKLINLRNSIENDSKKITDKLDLNDMSEQYNNFSETYFNNYNNELSKENEINNEFCNYNYKAVNLSNDNNEQFQNNDINDEYKMNNSENDDITMTKKELTSPERFFSDLNNNKIYKIKKENKINQQKNLNKKIIINETKNITSKTFGNNKKKSEEKIKKFDKKIKKYNTVTRIRGLKKNKENKTNIKINNSNSSSTIYKTLNKSYKSSTNKMQQKIKSYNTEKNNNIDNEFIIPKKYLNKNCKIIKTLNSEGKIINIYSNNKLEVIFKSGVKKEIFEDGFQIVNFTNGDLKQIFPDGKVIYYFKESKVTQITYNNGTQIFKFDNGQIEKHYTDGSKQISFPDGTIRYIYPNGYEETHNNKEEKHNKEKDIQKDELRE